METCTHTWYTHLSNRTDLSISAFHHQNQGGRRTGVWDSEASSGYPIVTPVSVSDLGRGGSTVKFRRLNDLPAARLITRRCWPVDELSSCSNFEHPHSWPRDEPRRCDWGPLDVVAI